MAIKIDSIKSEMGCMLLIDGNGGEELLTVIAIGGQDGLFSIQIISAQCDGPVVLLTKHFEGKRLKPLEAITLVEKTTENWTKRGLSGARYTDPLEVVKAFQSMINGKQVSIKLQD